MGLSPEQKKEAVMKVITSAALLAVLLLSGTSAYARTAKTAEGMKTMPRDGYRLQDRLGMVQECKMHGHLKLDSDR